MKYYKILINNKIVSIASELGSRRYQEKYKLILTTTSDKAEFISALDGKYYTDRWLKQVNPKLSLDIIQAEIEYLSEEDYKKLLQAFEKNGEINDIITEEEEEEEDFVISEDVLTQVIVKNLKLEELRKSCALAIKQGFSLIINSQERKFPLEITDQLNISRLYQQAINEETFLPYHSQDGLCENFSKNDIILLYEKMCEHVNYHTLYYNSLRDYVNSLSDDSKISSISYGEEIPEFFQSDALKSLMAK